MDQESYPNPYPDPWPESPPKVNHLFISSLSTFRENFMQIRSEVLAQSCQQSWQTNRDENTTTLADNMINVRKPNLVKFHQLQWSICLFPKFYENPLITISVTLFTTNRFFSGHGVEYWNEMFILADFGSRTVLWVMWYRRWRLQL